MEKYNLKKSLFYLITVLLLGAYACSKDSEYYKTFVEGGEIIYIGKIDSLKVFPGKNRIQIQGLITADPKVSELRIYWNLRQDSKIVPINRTGGIDAVSVFINDLEENIYNFEFVTYDDKGNYSVSQFLTAEVYGERYSNSLFNRPLLDNVLTGNDLTINFASMDLSSGVIGSELEYASVSGEQKTIFIPIENSSAHIADFKPGSTYTYRSAFLPEETAIDTFYTAFDTYKPLGAPVLGNSAVPFTAAETDGGRWGTLAAPWITNEAAKNHNGYGGWDAGCCGRPASNFNIESGWGSPAIADGKIYQTVTADPAKYQLKVDVIDANHNNADLGGAYFVVAKGAGLPDVEVLTSTQEVLGYRRINGGGLYIVEFTVEETTDISIGQLTTQSDEGRFCNIRSFEIVVAN